MRYITVDTKLVVLFGTPLRQSVSYLAQNNVYEALDLDYAYFPIELKNPEQLTPVITALREMNCVGFAITKPYKETILQYLDYQDPTVEKIQACNTVVIKDGKLTGYNTDGLGCVRSLREERGFDPAGKKIFSYGAGGAARAILFQLAAEGAKQITIAALDGMAQRLAEDLNRYYPGLCVGLNMDQRDELAQLTGEADLVMNLTGLGMAPHLDETPMDPAWLHPGQLCYDAIYNPEETRFMREAKAAGCDTLNGFGLVIYQGLIQAKLWTGADVPAEVMFNAVRNPK